MSIVRKPFPSQALHRPPSTLKLNLPGAVVAQLGLVGRGERLADLVERLEVGHRVRPARPADRRLVEEHHVVDLAGADQLGEWGSAGSGLVERAAAERGVERLLDERALARPADARTTQSTPSGKATSIALRLCPGRPVRVSEPAGGLPPRGRAPRRASGPPGSRR